MHTRRNSIVLLAAAFVSAGCGGSSGGGGVASGSGSSAGVQMAMNNFSFSPAVLNGTPGQKQTIHLTNSSGTAHNFTLKDQKINQDVDSGKDATVTITFPSSGQLTFVCEYHGSKGMTGTIVAGTGAASPMPSTSSGGGGGYKY